jgi:predicted transcriptional regulator
VRKLRETYDYSQESIAYQPGISQAVYCRRECGKTRFTLDCVQKLNSIYHLSLMDLINSSVQDLALQAIQNNYPKAA